MSRDLKCDRGNAVLEFVIIAVAVFMPLTYLVVSVSHVHAANMAASQAAREATRAFMMADTPWQAASAAERAAQLAMTNHGLPLRPSALQLTCMGECLSPGSAVRATIAWSLPMPWVPDVLRGPTSVPVAATHIAPIDSFRGSSAQ